MEFIGAMDGVNVNDKNATLFKALALKLKKELVKTKNELQALRESSEKEKCLLESRIQHLEEDEQINSTKIATLEAQLKNLRQQLDTSESDLSSLQADFDQYKINATQLLQQNTNREIHSNKSFEEERYKQLRELNEEQEKRISSLESQLMKLLALNQNLEKESKKFQMLAESVLEKDKQIEGLIDCRDSLSQENENLKSTLNQLKARIDESDDRDSPATVESQQSDDGPDNDLRGNPAPKSAPLSSPSVSIKDESQTNSSSSIDGSTLGGYVHIKPNAFEIISRSSVLEDAQNQIDNLTKAYLDSENTNACLSEQVKALKDEIRRMQRKAERVELAENLEYLKNVMFKFLSLDDSQMEQRKRLIPVLTTILKLSPEETSKLSSVAAPDKTGVVSSFFKL